MRNLLRVGIKESLKENSAKLYREGKITLSRAAELAGLTFFEMEQYLVERGYRSEYSIEDLEEDMKTLSKLKKR
jgi:predicted HTH domain antitoxin